MTTRQHTGVSPGSVIVTCAVVAFAAFCIGVLVGVVV
jgi:hypothetical protein